MKHKIEFDEKCVACEGTGAYVGMAERDGAGVVCSRCKGQGRKRTVIEYEDPPEKKPKRGGIKRVYLTNPGIVIGADKSAGLSLEDFGGMPYED